MLHHFDSERIESILFFNFTICVHFHFPSAQLFIYFCLDFVIANGARDAQIFGSYLDLFWIGWSSDFHVKCVFCRYANGGLIFVCVCVMWFIYGIKCCFCWFLDILANILCVFDFFDLIWFGTNIQSFWSYILDFTSFQVKLSSSYGIRERIRNWFLHSIFVICDCVCVCVFVCLFLIIFKECPSASEWLWEWENSFKKGAANQCE